MKKTLIIFGILLVLMPFLGFPYAWKETFYIFTGFVLLFIAFFNRRVALPVVSAALDSETPSTTQTSQAETTATS